MGLQRAPRRRPKGWGTGLPAGTSWEEPRDHSPPCTPVRVMQITFDKKSRAQRRVRFLASDGIAQDSIRERTRGAGYGKTFAGHQQQAWLTVQCVNAVMNGAKGSVAM